jgi:hypothetical protein
MDDQFLPKLPPMRPLKRRIAGLKQQFTKLQQLPQRVKNKAANLGELQNLILSKLKQSQNFS